MAFLTVLTGNPPQITGINTSIINALRIYGDVPVEILARVTDRRIHEVEAALECLKNADLLRIENGIVYLNKDSKIKDDLVD